MPRVAWAGGRSLELLVQIGQAARRSQLVERVCDPIVGGIRRPGERSHRAADPR